MDDLISKSALNEDLRAYADRKHMNGQTELANGILKAISRVKAAPAVDAVEVVRCKYCQHSSCAYVGAQRYCRRHYGERRAVEDMGFCSDGERS